MTPFELNLQNTLNIERQRFANKWLFNWHNINISGYAVDVEDFRGGRIHLGGVVFEGQPQQIYWQAIGRYLFSQIHEVFRRWNDETASYPAKARQSSLDGVQQILWGFIATTVEGATTTDRRLRGRGFPDSVPIYNSSREHTQANAELMRLVDAHRKLNEGDMDFLAAFADRIDRRLNEMTQETYRECQAIVSEMSSRGMANSGARIRKQLDALQSRIHRATDWALLEANDLPGQKSITRGLVRPGLANRLGTFADQLYTLVSVVGLSDNVGNVVSEHHLNAKKTLNGELNDFEQGIWKPRGPISGSSQMTTNNTVNIQGPNMGSVQQAGASSNQNAAVEFQVEAVEAALDEFIRSLSEFDLHPDTKAEITAEVGTIQIQLKRAKPNFSVIQAAVGGIYQLAMGVSGNVLTPHVLALCAAVGLR